MSRTDKIVAWIWGLTFFGVLTFLLWVSGDIREARDAPKIEAGRVARQSQVPAAANPYVGTSGYDADLWLRGWISGGTE